MRKLSLLVALLAALASPVMAAQQCASDADQATFEVLALRELMTVLVVKCNRADDYNNYFIKRFQPVLQQNERDALAYFRKIYGGAAQGKKDTFTTELVNVMSQIANTQGTEYCSRTGVVINEMLALKSMSDLAAYAAVKDIAPAGASMCPAASASRRR